MMDLLRKKLFFLCALILTPSLELLPSHSVYVVPRTHFGKGIGFPSGYSTLEITPGNANFLADLRGHFLNDNSYAANAGLVYRSNYPDVCSALGFNLFYDFRHDYGHSFNQIGLGIEYLTPEWELHANGYLPVGKDHTTIFKCHFDYEDGLFLEKKKTATALGGVDFRVTSVILDNKWANLSIEGGPYFFSDFFGALGNLTLSFKDRAFLKAMVTSDPVFGTRYQGEIGLTFFFGTKEKECSRRQKAVSRNEIIPLFRCCRWRSNF